MPFFRAFFVFCLITRSLAEINIKKEAFTLTQESCKTLSDQNSAAPILFAAADLIAVGKTGAIGKSYGPSNTKYSISMMPHCIVKGDTDKKELTIRNLGPGDCGAVDVKANDQTPYLFFLRATSDPKIYDILNLGAKKLDVPGMLWSPVFNYFCTVKNKKLCTGSECASQCTYETYPEGSCIQFEQNVIDAYNSLEAKRPKTTTARPTTAAPETSTRSIWRKVTKASKSAGEVNYRKNQKPMSSASKKSVSSLTAVWLFVLLITCVLLSVDHQPV